jgi:hypothetical protein
LMGDASKGKSDVVVEGGQERAGRN